jgi:glycosyltransferase involved in cell wall biosynthesis
VNENIVCLAPNRITPGKFYRLENREQLKIFGFVGSILPHHNVELLIRAFAKLQESKPESRLIIVGDGAQKEQLIRLSTQINIADKVTFTGKIPNDKIIQQLDKMDVCVMPGTNWYGSPVKIFEYGAACKAIIAPNQAPLRDVMVSGEHGLLTEENEASLIEAMAYMVNNPKSAIAMAENFHKEVMNMYTWEQAAKEILDEI